MALSSAEAEYIAATDASCEAIWLRRILSDLQESQQLPTTIHCDNMSTIAMSKNRVSCSIKAHWASTSFHPRFGKQNRNYSQFYQHKWSASKHAHKSYYYWEIQEIQEATENYKLRGGVKR